MVMCVKIYTISNPITGEIRYVGKTIQSLNERLRKHMTDKRNSYKVNWLKQLKLNGIVPEIMLIDECDESLIAGARTPANIGARRQRIYLLLVLFELANRVVLQTACPSLVGK